MKLPITFEKIAENILNKHYKSGYRSRKKEEIEYYKAILNVNFVFCQWSRYTGDVTGKYLNNKHHEYINKGIYEEIFKKVLTDYIEIEKYDIFKLISTDTSFIVNKCGTNLGRNKYKGNKRGIKISSITDANGIPLSLIVLNGNVNDGTILKETYEKSTIKSCANKYKQSNRHKQYFLADKGYDTKENIEYLQKEGYHVIIPQNKRNIKNKKLLRKLNKRDKDKLKKRHKIENSYAWCKNFNKLIFMFEKTIKSYEGLLKCAFSVIISRRIYN